MTLAAPAKHPGRVEGGRRAARKRWGEPRILRLDELDPPSRRLIAALYELAKTAEASDG